MVVVVPVDENAHLQSKIVPLSQAALYAFMTLDGLNISKVDFKADFKENMFDYFITCDKDEGLDEVFELGARVLIAPKNSTLEEIAEGVAFSELDEVS